MEISIKLTPEDVTEALRFFLASKGFVYVDHEFLDGYVVAKAEPGLAPASPAQTSAPAYARVPATPPRGPAELPWEQVRGPSSAFDTDDLTSPTREANLHKELADDPNVGELQRLLQESAALEAAGPPKPKSKGDA